MEEFKEIILYYKNYLIKKKGANLSKVNIKSNDTIKEYMKDTKRKLKELEKLSEKYKLYDDNYNDFMIAMGKLAIYLEKIDELNENNQFNEKIKMEFLNMHNTFEELEQINIMKDVYVWKFIKGSRGM
ncbi:hypothetical protein [Terrisporobacter sp.]